MLSDLCERLQEGWERYRKTADFDFGATPADLEDHYEIGDETMRKNAALYSLQLAFDAAADGDINLEEYEEIEEMAYDHVRGYYLDEQLDTDLIVPDVDRRTTEFRYHGCEDGFEERYRSVDLDDCDRVVAIESSGIEPGMVAAALNDTDYHIVRYSHRRLDDGDVIDLDPVYGDEKIALVDDEAYTGRTMAAVSRYLEQQGADVEEEPFRDTRREPLLERLSSIDWGKLVPG